MCKNSPDVGEEPDRNSYSTADGQASTSCMSDCTRAWPGVGCVGLVYESPQEESRSDQADHLVDLPHVDAL